MAGRDGTRLALVGPEGGHFGYGRMFLSLRNALSKHVTIDDTADVVVFMMVPTMVKGWHKGQRKVLLTMWETDELPPMMYELLPQFDQIVVPCEHNRELFSRYHPNVSAIPLGVDTSLWLPSTSARRSGPFRFLAGGSHWVRKGLDVVLDAFNALDVDAELTIKYKHDGVGELPPISNPRVRVLRDVLSPEEERDLYWDADCFISASRGEGWGLMPLQAMAAGIPTIMSDTSGHKEFSHLTTAIIPTTPIPANYGETYTHGNWDEPNRNALVELMRNPPPKPNHQQAAHYTWDNSARALLNIITPGNKLPALQWQPADQATVPVKALRNINSHIGNHHIQIEAGQTQRVSVNAKNVLLEAGLITLVQ